MKKRLNIQRCFTLVVILLVLSASAAQAQRFFNNPISQYYRNGYLWNPALAGSEGTRLYGLLNRSWIGFDGAPQQITFAGDMMANEKMGVGVQFTSDKSGVFQRYSGSLSYMYKLTFSDENSLRIGGSVGMYNERIDGKALVNDGQADDYGQTFNNKKTVFDGDMGLSYQSGALTLGATAYNFSNYFKRSDERESDLAVGQFMASIRFQCQDERINIKPLAAYKLFYNHTNIFTAATQLEFDEVFHAGLYWQSTGNMMGSVGLMYKKLGEVNFFYSGKNKYGTNQQYEVALKCRLGN